ncbi:glycosyltransferase [Hymenobacter sp. BRD67]|uniref:glycosyltransferase n=1 Tax=Hymenobacter sp. BRD67 TaxID=2675877 RepID=UPI001564EB3F|nr:glycosyltransferase [Hymenobacter sp. BRD67]QKG53562.1 glycosyltransferase [Hymenobacter sp. BRD67]
MDQLAQPARFHATREATATAPPALLSQPPTEEQLLRQAERALHRQLPPPAAALQACVIIPAKDEATTLPATLAALAAQTTLAGQTLPAGMLEVIVLANNCIDRTAAAVRQAARRHPSLVVHVAEVQLPRSHAHVGRARRLLLDEAAQRLEDTIGPTGVLLSTDADTLVASTWLAATLREIEEGAEAVGGRILTQTPAAVAPCPVRRIQLRDAAYRVLLRQLEDLVDPCAVDPWPSHHQHFGASLALTVRAYRQVGGLPAVPFLEDESLWQLLLQHDLPVRHSPRVQVYTSARRCGRVEVGLSWQLREWETLTEQQREPLVPCPHELVRVWRTRRSLRAWWQQGAVAVGPELARLARALEIPVPDLLKQARGTAAFGQLWQWVEATRGAILPVPLNGALRDLRTYLREGVSGCFAPAPGQSARPLRQAAE